MIAYDDGIAQRRRMAVNGGGGAGGENIHDGKPGAGIDGGGTCVGVEGHVIDRAVANGEGCRGTRGGIVDGEGIPVVHFRGIRSGTPGR